jgi:dTMP kinase
MEYATIFQSPRKSTFADSNDQGLLIVFEGCDGSGKTTQRKLFKSWLKNINEDVVVTKWNSSPLFKPIIKAKKTARCLNPVDFAHLHALDFRHRYETIIKPSLDEGKIVIADRYVFTGISRDVARGVSREWSMELYSGVRRPDIVFYFSGSPDVFAERIAASRRIKFYESGQDVTGLSDPRESYLRFARKVMVEYEKLRKQFDFIVVDAHESIYDQHRLIRTTYLDRSMASPLAQSFAAGEQAHLSAAI